MNRFILFEEFNEFDKSLNVETKKFKVLAEVVKFRNGKVASSFNLSVPSVSIFDNLDQFASVYCNEKIKLHPIPDKEPEKE